MQRVTPRTVAALYFRVSTLDQSTGMQETDLRRYAAVTNLKTAGEAQYHHRRNQKAERHRPGYENVVAKLDPALIYW